LLKWAALRDVNDPAAPRSTLAGGRSWSSGLSD
jgi:hypothetical protein